MIRHVTDNSLNLVGNTAAKIPRRTIKPVGADFIHKSRPNESEVFLILKGYMMSESGISFPEHWRDDPLYRLGERFIRDNIDPGVGMGFYVFSPTAMNISVWHKTYPDVIVPNVFFYENGSWERKDVAKSGAFCNGERRVLAYESEVWMKYLRSHRKEHDKERYLNDFLNLK